MDKQNLVELGAWQLGIVLGNLVTIFLGEEVAVAVERGLFLGLAIGLTVGLTLLFRRLRPPLGRL